MPGRLSHQAKEQTAAWMGYRELGVAPQMEAPLVRGEPVEERETVATATRIGNPASWGGAYFPKPEPVTRSDAIQPRPLGGPSRKAGTAPEPRSCSSRRASHPPRLPITLD